MSDNLSNKNNKIEQINSTKKYSVYRHIAPNNKCYVGISSNIKRR